MWELVRRVKLRFSSVLMGITAHGLRGRCSSVLRMAEQSRDVPTVAFQDNWPTAFMRITWL